MEIRPAWSTALVWIAVVSPLAVAQSVSGTLPGSQASNRSSSALSLTTSDGIGDAILAGLGQSSSATSSGSRVSNTSLTRTASQTSITDCQAAKVSWSTASASILSPYYFNKTTTYTLTTSANISYGTADVYTPLIDGYTHAHGELSVTSVQEITTTYHSVFTATSTLITPSGLSLPPYPNCTIDAATCSALYSAYSSSLGITASNATFPYISPVPTNSPRCRTVTGCTYYHNTDGCTVSGRSVHVFYWPPEPTATPSGTVSGRNVTRASNNTAPRTLVTSGITMTSPSVYLSFDFLSAYTYFDGGRVCESFAGGAIGLSQIGATHTSSWISMMPNEVSTLEKIMVTGSTTRRFPDAAITALGRANASDYAYWASAVQYVANGITASRLNFDRLTQPDARAYYLRPFQTDDNPDYPQGCFPYGPHSDCHTIFDGAYRAQLSLPIEVRQIDPAWSTCGPRLFGVRDPPIALTEVESAAAPADTITTTSAEPVITSASPSSPLNNPTVSPTSVTDDGTVIAFTPKLESTATALLGPEQSSKSTTSSSTQRVSSAIIENSAQSLLLPDGSESATAVPPPNQGVTSLSPAAGNTQLPQVTLSLNSGATDAQTPQVTVFSDPVNTPPQQSASNALDALTQVAPPPVSVSASAAPIAVITAGGSTITATSISGNVVVGSVTIASGQVATINGATVSNAATALVVEPTSPAAANQASGPVANGVQPAQPTVVATVGSQSIIAQPGSSAIIVGSSTLSAGQATTISGTVVSVGTSAVVIGSSTIALPTANPAALQTLTTITTQQPSIVVAGSTVTANPSGNFVIGSVTASAGGSAVTVSGTTLSVGPSDSYVIVNGQTSTLVRPTTRTIVVTVAATRSVNAGGPATTNPSPSSYTGSATQLVLSTKALFVLVALGALLT